MKLLIRAAGKHKILSAGFLIGLAFILSGVLWLFVALRNVSGPFILHFNEYEGINSTGNIWSFILFAVLGIVITILNFLIALEFEEKIGFWGKFISAVTLFLDILLFIAFAIIISVNG